MRMILHREAEVDIAAEAEEEVEVEVEIKVEKKRRTRRRLISPQSSATIVNAMDISLMSAEI